MSKTFQKIKPLIEKHFPKIWQFVEKRLQRLFESRQVEGEPDVKIAKACDIAEGIPKEPVLPFNFAKPKREVHTVFIHCSASDNLKDDDIEAIRKLHTSKKTKPMQWGQYDTYGKAFSDVGYHFFIQADGNIQFGRNIENSPASQQWHNKGTISICLHGENDFTEKQFESLKILCKAINKAYDGEMLFKGHCEVSDKPCPNFDYKSVLKLNNGKLW